MNRRRLAAAGFLSAVIAAVLAVIVYTEHESSGQTISVWILAHHVTGGAPYAASDVQRIQIRAQAGDFNYEVDGPGDTASRYTRSLSAGDIVRQDDLVAASTQAEVAINVQDPPPINAGDHVDIFATFAGDQQALIGRAVLVEGVAGGALTILVPVTNEQEWIAVGSSNVALHVARATAEASGNAPPVSVNGAIRILCGAPCAESAPVPTP